MGRTPGFSELIPAFRWTDKCYLFFGITLFGGLIGIIAAFGV